MTEPYLGGPLPAPPPAGFGFKMSDNMDQLIRIIPRQYDPYFEGSFNDGVKERVVCDVTVITGPNVGDYPGVWVTQKHMVPQVKDVIGQTFYARIAGKPTRFRPALYLEPIRPGDDAIIRAWLAQHPAAQPPQPSAQPPQPERYGASQPSPESPPEPSQPPQQPPPVQPQPQPVPQPQPQPDQAWHGATYPAPDQRRPDYSQPPPY